MLQAESRVIAIVQERKRLPTGKITQDAKTTLNFPYRIETIQY